MHSFCSTQFNLYGEVGDRIARFSSELPDEIIYEDPEDTSYGRENQPHITVKYGLHDYDPGKLEVLLGAVPPVPVTLGKISKFESDDYDVLKIDIESPELHELNAFIAGNFEVTDTHPEYKPHATIAYVKPGTGDEYLGDGSFEGMQCMCDTLLLSGREDDQLANIPLAANTMDDAVSLLTAP